jgi:hypothetical protein
MVTSMAEQFNEASAVRSLQLPDEVARAGLPPSTLEVFGERMLARPWFAPDEEITEFGTDLVAFFNLLVSIPHRLFDGDFVRYCEALGLDERRQALVLRAHTGRPPQHARADVYHDGARYKLLELNVGSELAGVEMAEICKTYLDFEPFRQFAEQHDLRYVRTAEKIARVLREVGRPVVSSGEPVIALLEGAGGLARFGAVCRSFQEVMAHFGLDVRVAEVGDVTTKDGKVVLDGTPIDVVLRNYSVNQLLNDPHGEAAAEPVFRAHEEGKTVLFTTMDTVMYSNKGNLALLHDHQLSDAFTSQEADLIDRMLPWTRRLAETQTDVDGETVDLVTHCQAHRDDLILKPRSGFGGIDTFPGWEHTDGEWRDLLTESLAKDFVVQRRVIPLGEPVIDPKTGELEDWGANFGTFITDEGYAGTYIRAAPMVGLGTIGFFANPSTSTTGLFQYPTH